MHGRAWQGIRQLGCGRARDGRQAGRQRQQLLHMIRISRGRPCRTTVHGYAPPRMPAQPAPCTASLTGAWAQACAQAREPAAARQRAARARGRTRAGLHVAHEPVRERARELGLAAPGVPEALEGVADARPARRRPASRQGRHRAPRAASRPREALHTAARAAAGARSGAPRPREPGSVGRRALRGGGVRARARAAGRAPGASRAAGPPGPPAASAPRARAAPPAPLPPAQPGPAVAGQPAPAGRPGGCLGARRAGTSGQARAATATGAGSAAASIGTRPALGERAAPPGRGRRRQAGARGPRLAHGDERGAQQVHGGALRLQHGLAGGQHRVGVARERNGVAGGQARAQRGRRPELRAQVGRRRARRRRQQRQRPVEEQARAPACAPRPRRRSPPARPSRTLAEGSPPGRAARAA